jgi:hypothetical protein
MTFSYEYRKLGDFTYHILSSPTEIKAYLMKWIMREWEFDHNEAPQEHWTVEWMTVLPKMDFALEILKLEDIHPNSDLMRLEDFQKSLKERADERKEAMLRGVSIEPLLVHRTASLVHTAALRRASLVHRTASLVNRNRFELMDGYTRYTVLTRYRQKEVYAYVGSV